MDRSPWRRRAEQNIIRLCHAGLDSRTLRIEALRRLRKFVPVDAAFCATVDPATLLFTGSMVEEIPEHATPAFLANEFMQDDVTKFVHLAARHARCRVSTRQHRTSPNAARDTANPGAHRLRRRTAGGAARRLRDLGRDVPASGVWPAPGSPPAESRVSGAHRAASGRRSPDGTAHRTTPRRPGA